MFRTSGFKHCEKTGCIRNGGEKRRKKEEREKQMSDHEHSVQENSLQIFAFYCGYLCQIRVLRPFAKSRNAQSSANIIFICFLLAVIINISFNIINEYYSSYKVIEETGYHAILIHYCFENFYAFSSFTKSDTRLYNQEMSINTAFSIVQYLYKFIKGE